MLPNPLSHLISLHNLELGPAQPQQPHPHSPTFKPIGASLTTHLALVGAVQPDKHLHEGHQLHLKLQPRAHLYYNEEG